jgi:phage terminase large subunit-like protein
VLGATVPRLWTPPLRDLTPDTSYGYDVIDFARDVLETPLDPWEEWAVIHAGELLPDGRPRFRTVLIIVARQNGKTLLAKVLILYWLFLELVPLVLGTSTDRSYAKRTWADICEQAKGNEWLARRLGPKAERLTIGEETLTTLDGAEYTFAANNRRAGRSMTLHRWVCDELREHSTWDAWNAATNAMNAVPTAQTVCITNMGDDTSIVLDSLRDSAMQYIETGEGDPRLGLLEWSAPPGADPTDLDALAQANPNLGRRVDPDALLGAALRAKRAGGLELTGFRTEVMCQRVHQLDPAIDPDAWTACGTGEPLDLAAHRRQVALCLDVALDGSHASLIAAAVVDGLVHVEVVERWAGYGCTKQLRDELPAIVAKVKPRAVGWYPAGPAAAVAADLAARPRAGWPPRRVELAEIRGDTTATTMGLAEQVIARSIRHPNDPMLDAHIAATTRLWRSDAWVFTRRGAGPIDGAYALAGAVHLARTLPPAPPPLAVA